MHKKRVSTLEDLPVNIILRIARHLPPRSVACLTLTSKSRHNAKGLKEIWTRGFDPSRNRYGCRTQSQPTCPPLKLVNHERYLVLQILFRDLLSTYQLCDACQILHLRYERGNERHVCSSTSRAFTIYGIPRTYWEFQDVQRIMNSYRSTMQRETETQFQPGSVNNDWCVRYRLVKTRTHQGPSLKQLPQIVKLDVEPRIIDDQLVFHTRQRVLLTVAVLDLMDVQLHGPKFTVGRLVNNLMSACPHYGGESQIIKAVNESTAGIEAKYLNQPVVSASVVHSSVSAVLRSSHWRTITILAKALRFCSRHGLISVLVSGGTSLDGSLHPGEAFTSVTLAGDAQDGGGSRRRNCLVIWIING